MEEIVEEYKRVKSLTGLDDTAAALLVLANAIKESADSLEKTARYLSAEYYEKHSK
jgi:hypothetical protein